MPVQSSPHVWVCWYALNGFSESWSGVSHFVFDVFTHLDHFATTGEGISNRLIEDLRSGNTTIPVVNDNRSNTHGYKVLHQANDGCFSSCFYDFEVRDDLKIALLRKTLEGFLDDNLFGIALDNDDVLRKEYSCHVIVDAQKHLHMCLGIIS